MRFCIRCLEVDYTVSEPVSPPFNPSTLLQNRVQVLTECLLDQWFPADGIIVKDDAITPNIEWEILAALSEENGRFIERVGIADFVVDVLIWRRDFRDHHLGIFDLCLNILEDDSRSI